jgi:hypothetical protein
MKRVIAIALLASFLFSTIGVVASSMKCTMKEMKTKKCCSPGNDGCCQKEVKLLKLQGDFVSPQHQKIAKPLEFAFVSLPPQLTETDFSSQEKAFVSDHHAPPLSAIERLTRIQSFLI